MVENFKMWWFWSYLFRHNEYEYLETFKHHCMLLIPSCGLVCFPLIVPVYQLNRRSFRPFSTQINEYFLILLCFCTFWTLRHVSRRRRQLGTTVHRGCSEKLSPDWFSLCFRWVVASTLKSNFCLSDGETELLEQLKKDVAQSHRSNISSTFCV